MLTLPREFASLMLAFAPLFSHRVFTSVQVLLVGAILAPGKRTITAILRVMGLSQEEHFQNYHRVLNRAVWSSRAVSRVLLQLTSPRVFRHGDSKSCPSDFLFLSPKGFSQLLSILVTLDSRVLRSLRRRRLCVPQHKINVLPLYFICTFVTQG